MSIRTLTFTIAALGASAFVAPAFAGGFWQSFFHSGASEPTTAQSQNTTMTIGYGDLDVSHEAGARALLSRITVAAREVCGGQPAIVGNIAGQRPLS